MFKYYVTHKKEILRSGEELESYDTLDIGSSTETPDYHYLADSTFVIRVMGHLMGRVLQTMEATFDNERQCKAVKDIVRSHFSDEMGFVSRLMFNEDKMMEAALGSDIQEATLATIDEVLGVDQVK